jgi:5-methylcytosine-specific restriction protein A
MISFSMPLSAPRPCSTPGCPELVRGRARCEGHTRQVEAQRGTATERGYDALWRAYRLTFLRANPICVICLAEKPARVTPATVVDHVRAHKGNRALFWDVRNHRAVCKPHHDERVDEGDFGRAS